MRKTPFHERTAPLNTTHLWEHWAGHVVATQYQHSAASEYLATRNAVAVLDTSPLFKYRFSGDGATAALAGIMTRDIRTCEPGSSQYTVWCNDDGYVMEDGVVLRLDENEYLVTSAEPNLRYFSQRVGDQDVMVEDVSDKYGLLAIQGPHSLSVLRQLSDDVAALPYFGVTRTAIGGVPVVVSRTGFTGDLGYEVWIDSERAVQIWDAIAAVGRDYNLSPLGMRPLGMARLDAGLLLIGVDFEPARHAWTNDQRETPDELGLDWMARLGDERQFIGRRAIQTERAKQTTRWRTVGFQVDAQAYEELYNQEGLVAPKDDVYEEAAHSIYDRDFNADGDATYVGYSTSFGFSPIMKRHIGLAKMPLESAAVGSNAHLELVVSHRPRYVPIEVVSTPFWKPERKTMEAPT